MNITVGSNLEVTSDLYIPSNLKTGKCYPYMKENNELLYIHKQSKHQPFIIKQMPSLISKRISDISWEKEPFDKAFPDYNNAPNKSGFNHKLRYTPTRLTRKNWQRNIIGFNSRFC